MCNYHRPVCVACRIDMRPEKNGVTFIEDDGTGRAYKRWSTDKWKRPECASEVLIGFGKVAYRDAFDEDFQAQVELEMKDPHTIREKVGGEK